MTSVRLPGVRGSGIADWGRRTPDEMIAQLRAYARNQKAVAEAILAAADCQFEVETHIGVMVRRKVEILQEARDPEPTTLGVPASLLRLP